MVHGEINYKKEGIENKQDKENEPADMFEHDLSRDCLFSERLWGLI